MVDELPVLVDSIIQFSLMMNLSFTLRILKLHLKVKGTFSLQSISATRLSDCRRIYDISFLLLTLTRETEKNCQFYFSFINMVG